MGLWVLNRGGLLDAVWRKGRQESLLQFLRADVGAWVKKERARISVDVILFVDGVKSKASCKGWTLGNTKGEYAQCICEVMMGQCYDRQRIADSNRSIQFRSDHDKKDKGRTMQKGLFTIIFSHLVKN